MKKISLILLVSTSLIWFACNFSKGTNKDLKTGLSYSYNGFSVSEVVLVGPDNLPLSNNEVLDNTTVAIVIQGLENYTLKEEKAFPGMMLSVIDKEGKTILENSDLFAGGTGYSTTDASILRGSFTIGDPMIVGETYHMKLKVWDKNKPETELVADVDLIVK